MKYSIIAIVAMATLISTVSAATGSTSTGSTSTGSTSTGSTSTVGSGGPTRAFNYTTNSYDLYPQCFPWAWLTDFYSGNIFMIYQNQKACQTKRAIDFKF